MDIFEEYARRLNVHPLKAQILVEVKNQDEAIERALSLLNSLQINWTDYRILHKVNPTLILIFLSSQDLQEAVKGLSEAGFMKFKGLNSQMDIIPNP